LFYLAKPPAPVDRSRLVSVARTALGTQFGARNVLDLQQVISMPSPAR
jgi:hypothetical protein